MIEKELRELLLSKGVSDVGFSYIDNSDTGELKYAVSIVVKLSDEIKNAVTDSINGHTKLVCIVFALLHFLLMDIGIKQIRDFLTAIELAGCNT